MARKAIKMTALGSRLEKLSAARAKLNAREEAALACFHPDDAGSAYASAEQNAYDTMVDIGRRKARDSSFAYRKALVCTLEMIADCAEDYGLRRVGE